MVHLASPFDPADDATPEELRTRLRALGRILAWAPVPIAVAHDAECRYISANDALARLLGVPPDVNISLTPPPGQQPLYRIERGGRPLATEELPMQYAIAHRCRVTNDIEIVRSDGTTLYVQNVEPLYDARGEACGCVSVCVDITDRKRAEDMLRETDRRKDEFLAMLSHELRNPLAPIRNALEVMRRPDTDDALLERAQAIMARQLHQLVRLTDDLLDVSRIKTDRLELRNQEIDLRDVIGGAIETTQPLVDAAGHSLTATMPDGPLWVYGDFTRLAQAFANLLNNAVKYTDRGGRLSIAAEAADGELIVQVRDTGIGIHPELMPRIFDMFMRAERSADRARSGLGIGLTLARRLVELHGGAIEAHSPGPGGGTTFTVRLPRSTGPAAQAPAERRDRPPVRCRVLIAEDIPDAAEMLCLLLEQLGHDVRVAADGVRAVAMAKEFDPAVALLDVGMPRMDGYEAAREIRAALGSRVTLVALTGWGQHEDQQRARAAGFDHHLTKPADPEMLERLIADAAGRA